MANKMAATFYGVPSFRFIFRGASRRASKRSTERESRIVLLPIRNSMTVARTLAETRRESVLFPCYAIVTHGIAEKNRGQTTIVFVLNEPWLTSGIAGQLKSCIVR